MSRRKFAVAFVLLVLVSVVALNVSRLQKGRVQRQTKSIPESYDDLKVSRYPLPVRRYLTPEESNAVQVAYLRITDAYTNGTVEVLRRRMAAMPDVVTNVHDSLHNAMAKPLGLAFSNRFLKTNQLRDFSGCAAFENYVESNMLVAKFLGNTSIRRGEYHGGLCVYEGDTLRNLRRYRDKFNGEGRLDLVRSADRFIGEWIDQIESEYGFTRWVLWHQLDLQWYLFEEGKMTRAELTKFIRFWS